MRLFKSFYVNPPRNCYVYPISHLYLQGCLGNVIFHVGKSPRFLSHKERMIIRSENKSLNQILFMKPTCLQGLEERTGNSPIL